ncbi:MAG: hypothetical protein ACXVHJ_36570 [Solirubrobacteraceae bacterium]
MLLAIDLASEPITGSVSIDGQASRRFNGWIELTAAIEAAGGRGRRRVGGGGILGAETSEKTGVLPCVVAG